MGSLIFLQNKFMMKKMNINVSENKKKVIYIITQFLNFFESDIYISPHEPDGPERIK